MQQLYSALVAAATAVLVTVVTYFLSTRQVERARRAEELKDRNEELKDRNLKYLHPLRLRVAENHRRLREISERLSAENTCPDLLFSSDAEGLRSQPIEMLNRHGAYLITTCYLTASLFFASNRIRRDLPFLSLKNEDDTKLLALLRSISFAYSGEAGIYFVTQDSIGAEMEFNGKLISYRQFCERLKDDRLGFWFDRLINFYIAVGRNERSQQINNCLAAMKSLLEFVESAMDGGSYIEAIERSEHHSA
jgi:hypothetical protein